MHDVLKELVDRLTDNYAKNPESNNSKFMQLAANTIQENEDTLFKIKDWRDMDQAQGKALDKIGGNVKQVRGQLPDETYRVLIKAKIKRTLSDGSIDTIIDFVSFILQIPVTDVELTELWAEGKDAALHLNVPAGPINATGLSLTQFGRLINLIVVAGVRAEVLFEGTFSFSSNYSASETSTEGFADDAGTTGGTLGYAYDPEFDVDLPI